jgi:hypothetical protein
MDNVQKSIIVKNVRLSVIINNINLPVSVNKKQENKNKLELHKNAFRYSLFICKAILHSCACYDDNTSQQFNWNSYSVREAEDFSSET